MSKKRTIFCVYDWSDNDRFSEFKAHLHDFDIITNHDFMFNINSFLLPMIPSVILLSAQLIENNRGLISKLASHGKLIPIIVRKVRLDSVPELKDLATLPKGGGSLAAAASEETRDELWVAICKEISDLIEPPRSGSGLTPVRPIQLPETVPPRRSRRLFWSGLLGTVLLTVLIATLLRACKGDTPPIKPDLATPDLSRPSDMARPADLSKPEDLARPDDLGPFTIRMGSSPEEIMATLALCKQPVADGGLQRCKANDIRAIKAERQETVLVQPVELDATEVTNAAFAEWLNRQDPRSVQMEQDTVTARGVPLLKLTKPAAGIERVNGRYSAREDMAQRPVVLVTWHGAQRYCASQGKRLPSSAEWEHAARPTGKERFPWGNDEPRCDGVCFGRRGRSGKTCEGEPQSCTVGSSRQDRTAKGIADLAGNVHEWVGDTRPGSKDRIVRGGAFNTTALWIRSTTFNLVGANDAGPAVGFRCARALGSH